jgi:hypothetical protein
MKKILFILLILFIPIYAYSAPTSSLSITPAAVDGNVIEAADENTRNNAISTWANAHDHEDISQVGNTLNIGDGSAGNKTIQFNNADTNKPFLRYDDTNDRVVVSPDGTNVQSILVMTGASPGAYIFPESPSDGKPLIYNATGTVYETIPLTVISDSDEDTGWEVERTADDDIIYGKTGGTDRWIMTAAGERTMPTQPSFMVHPASTQTDVATGGVTIVFGTERFDQGNDFSTNTFTAPVTGKYSLSISVSLDDIDQATTYQVETTTSNNTYTFNFDPTKFSADLTNAHSLAFSVIADMDANDTATISLDQAGGATQTDILVSTFFSGTLEN